jgi:hypothetical protein
MRELPDEIHGAAPILLAELDEEAQVRGPAGFRIDLGASADPDVLIDHLEGRVSLQELGQRPDVTVETLPPRTLLVIAEAKGEEGGYYLLGCDDTFEHVSDTHHETLEAAKGQAEYSYPGITLEWQEVR